MDSPKHYVILLGDQTYDCTPLIRQLYADSKDSALLADYLQKCTDILQVECSKLDPSFRHEVPHFESILEMAEEHAKTDGSPVLMSSFLCYVGRSGDLVLRAERDPSILQSNRTIIGLCISLYPALLSAFSRTASELAMLAEEALPTFVEMAKKTHIRSKSVEWEHGYWSYLVMRPAEMKIETCLDDFSEKYKIFPHRRPWIGVESRTWSTISAPPSTLNMLIENSPQLKDLPGMFLPIGGAVHAPYLPLFEFNEVRRETPIWDLKMDKKAVVMGTNECAPYQGENLGHYAQAFLHDVLIAQLRPDRTFHAAAELLKNCDLPVEIITAGPSAQIGAVLRALKNQNIKHKLAERPDVGRLGAMRRGGSGAIAICGMAGRFPGSQDMDSFWETMMEGKTFMQRIPSDRFNLDEFYDKSGKKKNSMVTTEGCFIDEPGAFDPKLFKMSPREVMQMDPTHRLLLMVTMEALEKAGHNPENTPAEMIKRTSVWFGQNADVWREIDGQMGLDVFTAPGILRAFSPGRVNYFFGFEGGSYSLDAACSSSSTTIQLACTALERRECDMAIAGGAQIASNPFEYAALGKSGFLSKEGGCKTFRADADGYCRGEAVGVVTLKRIEDAIADNDNIQAVITGWGRNYSADAQSITHPHAPSQKKLYGQVLRQANRTPADIGYVELHGTGTIAGDLSEMKLVTSTFNGHFTPENPIHVGALKANFGHSEAAAGVSSTIKAAMMAKRGICPPQASITPDTELHPGFTNLDMSTIKIDHEPSKLTKTNIMVNNFDAAGGNTCLLIEAPPPMPWKSPDPRTHHIITISARTNTSLQGNKRRLLSHLTAHPSCPIADVAYTLTARRIHHQAFKTSFVASTTSDLILALHKDGDFLLPSPTPKPPSLIWTFTGQGSHYPEMASSLYTSNSYFRSQLDSHDRHCVALGLPTFLPFFQPLSTSPTSPASLATFSTTQIQLATLALELSLASLWQSWGLKPSMVLGHSLGEYAALVVAGVLSAADALWLVGTRARLLEEAEKTGRWGMLGIREGGGEVERWLAGMRGKKKAMGKGEKGKRGGGSKLAFQECKVACHNGPKSSVVSGPMARLEELRKMLREEKGVNGKVLPVSYAFHSPQMDSICEIFREAARSLPFNKPKVPVVSSVTGEIIEDAGVFSPTYLARHARQPVRFMDALQTIEMTKPGKSTYMWLEIGPGPINSTFIGETLEIPASELLVSMKFGEPNWKTLCTSLSRAYNRGVHVAWPEFHREYTNSVSLLDLPTYHFDLRTFWKTYTAETAAFAGIDMGNTAKPYAVARDKFVPTSTLQKIVSEKINEEKISVTFESDLSNELLREVLDGHKIEGFAVCPASGYVDMAAGASKYIFSHALVPVAKKVTGSSTLTNLELVSPLVMKDRKIQQIIQIRATAEKKDKWTCHVSFHSRTGSSAGKFDDNGRCSVESPMDDVDTKKAKWEKGTSDAKARVNDLLNMQPQTASSSSFIHHMSPRIFYQLFNDTVRYGPRYRGCREAFLDYEAGDAATRIVLTDTKHNLAGDGKGGFTLDPFHGDSVAHLPGMLLNTSANESSDDEDMLYFSSGMERMHMFRELRPGMELVCYTKTTKADGEKGEAKTAQGVLYLFDEAMNLFGVAEGMKFHQMKRKVLNMSLQLQSGISSSASSVVIPVKRVNETRESLVTAAATIGKTAKKVNMADIFLDALITETGVETGDLDDASLLTELGVDSLMGMAVLQRVQQVTGTALPASVFLKLQTVGDVKDHLGSSIFETRTEPLMMVDEGAVETVVEQVDVAPASVAGAPEMAQVFLEALMLETGVQPADLDDATLLTELGVDSLMGMAVLQRVQQLTGEILPATIFFELQTIGDVKSHFGTDSSNGILSTNDEAAILTPSEDNTSISSEPSSLSASLLTQHYKSNAVLLQGDPHSPHNRPIFFIAGSSGSASIYAKLPPLKTNEDWGNERNLPMYALESPFLSCPQENKYSPSEIAPIYLSAIRAIQPEGPYLIGGYSAGAVHAYEVARLLLNSCSEEKNQVDHLLLVDMKAHRPGETWLEPPSRSDHDILEIPLFSSSSSSASTLCSIVDKQHGNRQRSASLAREQRYASLACVYAWKPEPMPPGRRPRYGTTMIWAGKGMCERFGGVGVTIPGIKGKEKEMEEEEGVINPMGAEYRGYKGWFFGRRFQFDDNGWGALCGEGEVRCRVVEGADHWNILEMPFAAELVRLMNEAVTSLPSHSSMTKGRKTRSETERQDCACSYIV